MEITTIKTLSENPPPPNRKWKFATARTAHAEINRLQSLLGLPQTKMAFNLGLANDHIRELEAIAAKKAAPSIPVVPPAAPKNEPEKFGLARASSSVRILGQNDEPISIPAGLKGLDRFRAAVKIRHS